MKLKILGCQAIELSLDECVVLLDKFPRAKLEGYTVKESGVLDEDTIKGIFKKEWDRKGQPISTYHIDENLRWILFYYVSKTDYDKLSYDIRDSLYSIDIETQRPRETTQKSRVLVVGLKPSIGKICILSPRGEIHASDVLLITKWLRELFLDNSREIVDLELHDNDLIDITDDCLRKDYRVDGANLIVEDLSFFVHCREKSLVDHHLVKSTEESLQIEQKIRNGEWKSIAIDVVSDQYPYVVYFSKSRNIWNHLTISPSVGSDRMSILRAAPIFESVLSLVSMSLVSRPQKKAQTSLSDFY